MYKTLLIFSAVCGLLSVLLGAFAAHGLEAKLGAEQLTSFKTGTQYQMYHALAALLALLFYANGNNKLFLYSALLFLLGILFFSGSIYLLSSKNLLGIENIARVLGPITPIGGLCFIVGWFLMLLGFLK